MRYIYYKLYIYDIIYISLSVYMYMCIRIHLHACISVCCMYICITFCNQQTCFFRTSSFPNMRRTARLTHRTLHSKNIWPRTWSESWQKRGKNSDQLYPTMINCDVPMNGWTLINCDAPMNGCLNIMFPKPFRIGVLLAAIADGERTRAHRDQRPLRVPRN